MCLIDICCCFTSFCQDNVFYYLVPPSSKLAQEQSAKFESENVLTKPIGKLNLHNLFAFAWITNKTRKKINYLKEVVKKIISYSNRYCWKRNSSCLCSCPEIDQMV